MRCSFLHGDRSWGGGLVTALRAPESLPLLSLLLLQMIEKEKLRVWVSGTRRLLVGRVSTQSDAGYH